MKNQVSSPYAAYHQFLRSNSCLNSLSDKTFAQKRRNNRSYNILVMKNGQYLAPKKLSSETRPRSSNKSGLGDSQKTNVTLSRDPEQAVLNIKSEYPAESQIPVEELVARKHNLEIASPPTHSSNGQYSHPFFSLPESIRVKIFKNLTHTERLLAEFVCRRFRNDIRLRVGLRTKITEETIAGLAFLRDVLVVSIIVGKYDRPITGPSRLICNCENIQELIFEEPICVQYLDGFLNRCRKIKWLIIRTTVIDTAIFPPAGIRGPFNTTNEWRSLEMIHKYPVPQNFLKELILYIPSQHCLRTVNRTVSLLNTPALERFCLMVNQPIAFEETTAVHFAVLNYLKNCINVSQVIICTEQKPSTLRYPSSRTGNVQLLERELNQYVGNLHLKSLILTEPAVAFETWNIVLNNQNSLETLQVLHMTIWPLLRDIVIINAKSLVKVALHAILWDKYGKHSPIDLNVFSRSVNLKELYICIAPPAVDSNANNKDKDKAQVDFVNFHKLPKLLEILALKHCHLNMKDFLGIRNLHNLKSLGVASLNSSGEANHVGIKTLRKLLHIRSLDELFISGLVVDGPTDTEALKEIMDLMKAKVKEKRKTKNTFHYYTSSGMNRWSVSKNSCAIFTIFSNWGFISY